jgi:hypothetical protein
VEGARGAHSELAFASSTFAFGFSVIGWAEPAGEPADADFDVICFHQVLFPKGCLVFGALLILVFGLPKDCAVKKRLLCLRL